MLGRLNHHERRAIIIGGGAAGLFTAYHLIRRGFQVELHEASPRVGGLIETLHQPLAQVERAAHSYRNAPAIQAMCAQLKLNVLSAATTRKYILRNAKLRRFPLDFFEMLAMLYCLASRRGLQAPSSMEDWARQHLGEAALQHLISPLVSGIYAATPQHVLQPLAFPQFSVSAKQSLLQAILALPKSRVKPQMMAPEGGMGALMQALADFIKTSPGCALHLNSRLAQLPQHPNVILCTPADAAANLLADAAPIAAAALRQIDYVPIVAAHLVFRAADIEVPDGVGVLYSAQEPRQSLGVLFNSASFPNRAAAKHVSFTMLLGGVKNPEILALADAQLEALVMQEMQAIFSPKAPPLAITLTRWPRALPLYNAALPSLLARIKAEWCATTTGRILFGNYTGEISLRGLCERAATLAQQE